MKAASVPLVALALALLSAADQAQAGEGWFGGIQVAPWMTHADALLNLERGGPLDVPVRKVHGSTLPLQTRRFAVELSYADGSADSSSFSHPAGAGRDFRVAGVGTWAVNDSLGVTGRVGAYRGDVDGSNLYRLAPDAGSLHPTIGMGLRYDISPSLRLQGGWDRYHLGVSLHPGDGGVDLLSIGLKYRF